MSFHLSSDLQRPFNLPKAHSTTTRALLSLLLNFCCLALRPTLGYAFISHGNKGYTGSPNITTGTGTPEKLRMWSGASAPASPLKLTSESDKSHASWTLPGQLTSKIQKSVLVVHQPLQHNEWKLFYCKIVSWTSLRCYYLYVTQHQNTVGNPMLPQIHAQSPSPDFQWEF